VSRPDRNLLTGSGELDGRPSINYQQQPQYSDENAYPRDDSDYGANVYCKSFFDECDNSYVGLRTRILDNHGNGGYKLYDNRLFMAA